MREGWTSKTLGEACENLDSRRVPITKSKRVSGDIPYYGASGVVDHVADYIFNEDLLLVSEDGANLLARTYPIAFSISGKSWVNNHAHVLRFKEIYSQKFVEYYLNSISLEPHVSGMAQPKLNQKSLNSIPIPDTSLPEQKRIVAILDEAFAAIATATANTEKNLANARELFESELNRVLSQKGDGWVEKQLNDTCDLITCGVAKRPEYVPYGIPFLSAKNVKNGQIVWSGFKYIAEETHRTLTKHNKPKLGDVLYTRVGSYGEAAIVDREDEFSVFVSLTLIKPKPTLLNRFLKYYLNSYAIKQLASKSISGSGVGNLNVGTVRKFPIRFPLISEQETICDSLDSLANETQRHESLYQQKLAALAALKQSILHKAFTGELTSDHKAVDSKLKEAGV